MTSAHILQPGQFEGAVGDIPELILPPANLFANRAQRFLQLAEGHGLADYLLFLSVLAECQQNELDTHPDIPVPDTHLLENCYQRAMPPIDPATWSHHPRWLEVTRRLTDTIVQQNPLHVRQTLTPLIEAKDEWLETQANHLLKGRDELLDLAASTVIGASLQVQWTYLARRLHPPHISRTGDSVLCPVCNSPPVASVIHTESSKNGLRYLQCMLCGSEWHVVRAKCSRCCNTKDIEYYALDGVMIAVQAEACPACCSYLKVIHQEKDSRANPVADDIATLALDFFMGKKNFTKSGLNLFMMQ